MKRHLTLAACFACTVLFGFGGRSVDCRAVNAYVYPGLPLVIEILTDGGFEYDHHLNAQLRDEDGRIVTSNALRLEFSGRKLLNLDVASVPKGDYRLEWQVEDWGRAERPAIGPSGAFDVRLPDSPVRFDGRLPVIGGQGRFLFGMYLPYPNERDGEIIPEQSAAQSLRELPRLADAGFDIVQVTLHDFYLEENTPVMRLAGELGLLAVVQADAKRHRALRLEYPHLLAWSGADEPEIQPDRRHHSPESLRDEYRWIKSNDDTLPIFVNHCRTGAMANYIGARDIIASDPYPYNKYYPPRREVDFIRAMRETVGPDLPVWVILQAHGFGDTMFAVTPEQMRSQSYIAMMLGVDLLFYYCTATPEAPGWLLTEDPGWRDTWLSMKPLLSELREHMEFFRNPVIAASRDGDAAEAAGILWRISEYRGRPWLLVAGFTPAPVDCRKLLPVMPEGMPEKLSPFQVVFLPID